MASSNCQADYERLPNTEQRGNTACRDTAQSFILLCVVGGIAATLTLVAIVAASAIRVSTYSYRPFHVGVVQGWQLLFMLPW